MNHTEMPLANLIGHGDVGAYSLGQIKGFCDTCGLKIEKLEAAKKFRMHLVASKGPSGASSMRCSTYRFLLLG